MSQCSCRCGYAAAHAQSPMLQESTCFGLSFTCDLAQVMHLCPVPVLKCQGSTRSDADLGDIFLQAAKDLGVNVKGVSFHVGSGATDPEAFREAIRLARGAFDTGTGMLVLHSLERMLCQQCEDAANFGSDSCVELSISCPSVTL